MKQIVATGVLVAVLAGYLGISAFSAEDTPKNETPEQSAQAEYVEVEQKEEQVISDDSKEFKYSGVVGETALETLKGLADVQTQESSFGEFVTTINGVEADQNSEYWAFYINGKLAAVGAGAYVQQEGDEITWQLETL